MKIGMIGGIGPESTVDYYRRIIESYRKDIDSEGYPQIIIYSIDMNEMLSLVKDKDWDALAALLTEAVGSLYKAGAGFAFMACNTSHIVFDTVQKASPIPLVSIVEAARLEAESLSLKRVGLLGTLFTMQNGYYQAELSKSGIKAVLPSENEQRYIENKLIEEIEHGIFLDDTKKGLLKIIKRMVDCEAIDGIILGCTELPLILNRDEYGIPFLNTTEIHVRRIIEKYSEMCMRH